jgi:nucleoside-diphosphate-sugar epimerase
MRIFVTGASVYIGKVAVEHAVRAGHVVEGLARNQEAAVKVSQLGATLVVGDLQSFDVLAAAASRADAILHLAYIHDFSLDHSIVIDTDVKAVTALAKGARGKPIITTSGTAVAAPEPDGGETDETQRVNATSGT